VLLGWCNWGFFYNLLKLAKTKIGRYYVGFSEVHKISMKRVILALLIIPTALFLILAALVVGVVFIAGY